MNKETMKKVFTPQNLHLILLILLVVNFVCFIQVEIFNQNILFLFGVSVDDFVRQFLLYTANPTFVSAFTTNYIHFKQGHIQENLGGFVIAVVFILFIYLIRERTQLKIPKIYFIIYAIFAFLLLPFIISFVSCINPPAESVNGFSGIMFSFVGAVIALFHPLLYLFFDMFQCIHRRKYLGLILSYMVIVISFIFIEGYFTRWDLASPNNVFVLGHITGACCGFLFTLIFDGVYRKKHHRHSG